jgi:hypothetical protein
MRRLISAFVVLSVMSALVVSGLGASPVYGDSHGQTPTQLPATGTGGPQTDTSLTVGWFVAGVLVVLVLGSAGALAARRTR